MSNIIKERSMHRLSAVLVTLFVTSGTLLAQTPAPVPTLNGLLRGVVTDVKGPNITVMRSIVVDTGNARLTRRGKTVAADVLAPGSRVTIAVASAKPNKPDVLVADSITIEQPEATLNGPLEAVSATTIKILGQQIAIAAETWFGGFVDGKAAQSTADLKTGYPIEVEIVPGADGPVAASVLAIGPSPRVPQPPTANHATVTGTISAIQAGVWTVGGTNVYVVEQKTRVTGGPVVGDTVEAEGLRTPEGAIIANTIVKR